MITTLRHVVAALSIGASACGGGSVTPDATPDAPPVAMTFHTQIGDAAGNLPFVAFQDGDGEWQALSGLGGRYDTSRTSDRFGLAWVCKYTIDAEVVVFVTVAYAAADDTFPDPLICDPMTWAAIGGSVTGLVSGQSALITIRDGVGQVSFGQPSFTGVYMPPATHDVIAVRRQGGVVHDVIVEHDRVVDQGSPISINFAGAFVPQQLAPMETANSYSSGLVTNRGADADIAVDTTHLWRLPAAAIGANDRFLYQANGDHGTHTHVSHSGGVVPLPVPTSDATATIDTIADGADSQFSADFVVPETPTVLQLYAEQAHPTTNSDVFVNVLASKDWLGGATKISNPGLAGVAGWNSEWSLGVGNMVSLYAGAQVSNAGFVAFVPRFLNDLPYADETDIVAYSGTSKTVIP